MKLSIGLGLGQEILHQVSMGWHSVTNQQGTNGSSSNRLLLQGTHWCSLGSSVTLGNNSQSLWSTAIKNITTSEGIPSTEHPPRCPWSCHDVFIPTKTGLDFSLPPFHQRESDRDRVYIIRSKPQSINPSVSESYGITHPTKVEVEAATKAISIQSGQYRDILNRRIFRILLIDIVSIGYTPSNATTEREKIQITIGSSLKERIITWFQPTISYWVPTDSTRMMMMHTPSVSLRETTRTTICCSWKQTNKQARKTCIPHSSSCCCVPLPCKAIPWDCHVAGSMRMNQVLQQ